MKQRFRAVKQPAQDPTARSDEAGIFNLVNLPLSLWPFIVVTGLIQNSLIGHPALSLTLCLDKLCTPAAMPYSHILSQDKCKLRELLYFANVTFLPRIIFSFP